MIEKISNLRKQVVSITDPELWFYSVGLYVFGVLLATALFPQSKIASVGLFVFCLVRMAVVGMVFGLSHAKDSHKFVFPWEFLFLPFNKFVFGNQTTEETKNDINRKISIAVSGTYVFLFFIITVFFFNVKILLLGLALFLIDFLYNSRYTNGKFNPYIDVLAGGVYTIPLFIGYVVVTDRWPDTLLALAAVLYCVALEAYARTLEVNSEHLRHRNTSVALFGEKNMLFASISLISLAGVILTSYSKPYFLLVIPFLVIFYLSLHAKNHDEKVRIHSKVFFVHTFLAFSVLSYFFAIMPQ